jgi:hypothetical protein
VREMNRLRERSEDTRNESTHHHKMYVDGDGDADTPRVELCFEIEQVENGASVHADPKFRRNARCNITKGAPSPRKTYIKNWRK